MRILFMGTPRLAAAVLERVIAAHDVVAVFTRPDAVRGRGKKLVASPVKEKAIELGVPVHEAASLKDDKYRELIEDMKPDVICVAAYGAILPPSILEIPKFGCLNVHTSLLPRWRGAAPIERAIIARDEETGVCIMKMEEGLDTGAWCVRRTVSVDKKYLADLAEELAHEGGEALVEAIEFVASGVARWHEQGESGVTYAKKIEKGELDFDASEAARDIEAKVRASSDSHPSRIEVAGRTISVERAKALENDDVETLADELEPGDATFVAKRLIIKCADGAIELEQVKPDGKKSMEGRAFAAGIQGIKNTKVAWGRA